MNRINIWLLALIAFPPLNYLSLLGVEVEPPAPIWVAELPLQTVGGSLGTPLSIPVDEGKVKLGQWQLYKFSDTGSSRALYVAKIPLSLERLAAGRIFYMLQVEFDLGDSSRIVQDLFPNRITTYQEIPKLILATPDNFKFDPPCPPGFPSFFPSFRSKLLEQRIHGIGIGQSAFQWTFEAEGNKSLEDGDREVYALLDLPGVEEKIQVEVKIQARLAKELLGSWRNKATLVNTTSINVDLTQVTPLGRP